MNCSNAIFRCGSPCIVAGVAPGHLLPGLFATIASAEIARVNLPVAGLVWLMIILMLLKIDFGHRRGPQHWRGVGVTLFINWAVEAVLDGVAGFTVHRPSFRTLAVSGTNSVLYRRPHPAGGGTRTAIPGSNSARVNRITPLARSLPTTSSAVFAFAPLVGPLLGVASISVPWDTPLISVVLYIVVPVIVAQLWRHALIKTGPAALQPNAAHAAAGLAGGAVDDAGDVVRFPGRADSLSRSRW